MGVGRKKSFEIIKSTKRSKDIKGFFSGRGWKRRKFDNYGRMILHDEGEARAINQKYGHDGGSRDVVVIPVDDLRPENKGTRTRARRVWSIRVPWKK